MNLRKLTQRTLNRTHSKAAPKRAFIHALEGDIYLVEMEQNGISHFAEDPSNKVKRFPSLVVAKAFAKKQGASEVAVGLKTPYDEMIGLASIS